MLKGSDLGAAIDAARIAKGMTKVQLGKQFGVKPPSVHNWIVKGTIERDNLLALIQFFAGTVGPSHWGLPEIDGVDTRLTLLINQLTDDLQSGRLDEDDIQMLSNLALRISSRNG